MPHDIRKLKQILSLLKGPDGRRLSWQAVVAALALLAIYVVARPTVEHFLGLDLPHLVEWDSTSSPPLGEFPANLPEKTSSKSQSPKSEPMPTGGGALSSFLMRTGNNVFESPAGLIYRPGSAHGHRLKHIMAHTVDVPDRPGQHGVFATTDALEVFQLLDEAYEQVLTGKHTKAKHEGSRTIYTINLRRTIGTIGGESGNRRGNPTARHLQLVLDGKNVITAYPVRR